jgi:hypothetical protein
MLQYLTIETLFYTVASLTNYYSLSDFTSEAEDPNSPWEAILHLTCVVGVILGVFVFIFYFFLD